LRQIIIKQVNAVWAVSGSQHAQNLVEKRIYCGKSRNMFTLLSFIAFEGRQNMALRLFSGIIPPSLLAGRVMRLCCYLFAL